MTIPTDFGGRVRAQRQLRGLSQRELATMTDENPVTSHPGPLRKGPQRVQARKLPHKTSARS